MSNPTLGVFSFMATSLKIELIQLIVILFALVSTSLPTLARNGQKIDFNKAHVQSQFDDVDFDVKESK